MEELLIGGNIRSLGSPPPPPAPQHPHTLHTLRAHVHTLLLSHSCTPALHTSRTLMHSSSHSSLSTPPYTPGVHNHSHSTPLSCTLFHSRDRSLTRTPFTHTIVHTLCSLSVCTLSTIILIMLQYQPWG